MIIFMPAFLLCHCGLDMSFKSLGIDEKEWNDHVEHMAFMAYEDQCSPANPRVPLVEDMVKILKAAYNGYQD